MTDNLQSLFQLRIREMGGWCEIVESLESVCALLGKKYAFDKNEIVFSGRVTKLLNGSKLTGVDVESIHPGDRREILAHAMVGITTCDGLIAETGTAVLVNHPSEPRELSLLPERHIVVATDDQLYESLNACLSRIKESYLAGSMPSLTLVSGPSRTSDIEKTLVVGVHGPKEFGVVVIGT